MFEIGLIRVLTSDDQDFVDMHGRLIERLYPNLNVTSACIPDQREGIHGPEQEAQAIPKIVALATERFAHKDMILVSCAEDPGVEQIREALPGVLVTGGGESASAMALRIGGRVGVLGITDVAPKAYIRLLGDRLVGNYRPELVHSSPDLLTDAGRRSCIDTSLKMKADGCEVIALGCTGLATIGIAGQITQITGLQVVDPVIAMGACCAFHAATARAF